MFVPLSDENPLRSIKVQWVTLGLIAANVLGFLWQLTGTADDRTFSFALIPAELFQVRIFGGSAKGLHDTVYVPEAATLVSSTFLHGDFWHLAGNMVFLWVFGDNVEDAMGHMKFLLFYVLCGVAASLTHAAMLPTSTVPLIGASGAVAGVIAAYLLLHPHVRVWVLAFRFFPLNIPASWALGAWVATQFAMLALQKTGVELGPVAWWAHVGGLVAGAVLILFMRRPGVPLLDRPRAVV